jgi:hypothetical protein
MPVNFSATQVMIGNNLNTIAGVIQSLKTPINLTIKSIRIF